MMAAALAAAEAALREASAPNETALHGSAQHQMMEGDMEHYAQDSYYEQEAEFVDSEHGANQEQLLTNLMQYQEEGGGENMQYLLELMAQQEEQQKAQAALQAARRPTEHYMTIAHDGE